MPPAYEVVPSSADMDVDQRAPYDQQQQWYRHEMRADIMQNARYGDSSMSWYKDQQSHYTLPPLSSSQRSQTLPTLLPIPNLLPFPSSKPPVSAPPHGAHHNYASACPIPRLAKLSPLYTFTKLRPISPTANPTVQHATSAVANSKIAHNSSALSVSALPAPKRAPIPPPSLPPSVCHTAKRHTIPPRQELPLDAQGEKDIIYTDDTTTKLRSYIHRRCYNCHTSNSAAWRRSGMHPGKVLCNKCGLYKCMHQKAQPHDPAKLCPKLCKTPHPGVPSSPGGHFAGGHSPGSLSPVDEAAPLPLDAIPPRLLTTHASLLQMHAQNPPAQDEPMRKYAVCRSHPHSLGLLLDHPALPPHDASCVSPHSNTKDLHLSPAHFLPIYPPHVCNGGGSSVSSPHSVDRHKRYDKKRCSAGKCEARHPGRYD